MGRSLSGFSVQFSGKTGPKQAGTVSPSRPYLAVVLSERDRGVVGLSDMDVLEKVPAYLSPQKPSLP